MSAITIGSLGCCVLVLNIFTVVALHFTFFVVYCKQQQRQQWQMCLGSPIY